MLPLIKLYKAISKEKDGNKESIKIQISENEYISLLISVSNSNSPTFLSLTNLINS